MPRYQKLRNLPVDGWKGLGSNQRQRLKRYVAGAFRGFYAEVDGETVYLGRLVEGRGDNAYMVVNQSSHTVARGSAPRDAYNFVASKILKAAERRMRRIKARSL